MSLTETINQVGPIVAEKLPIVTQHAENLRDVLITKVAPAMESMKYGLEQASGGVTQKEMLALYAGPIAGGALILLGLNKMLGKSEDKTQKVPRSWRGQFFGSTSDDEAYEHFINSEPNDE